MFYENPLELDGKKFSAPRRRCRRGRDVVALGAKSIGKFFGAKSHSENFLAPSRD